MLMPVQQSCPYRRLIGLTPSPTNEEDEHYSHYNGIFFSISGIDHVYSDFKMSTNLGEQVSHLHWQNHAGFQAMIPAECDKWLEKIEAHIVGCQKGTGSDRFLPDQVSDSLSKAIRGILLSAKLTAQPSNAISPLTQAMKDKRCSEAANMKEWAQLTAANRNESMHPRIRKGVQVFNGLGGLKSWNTHWYLHTFFFILPSIKLTVAKHKIYQLKGTNISFFLGYDASSYTFHHLLYPVQKVSTPGVKKPVIPSTSHHLNSVWKPWPFLIPYNPAPAPFSPFPLKSQSQMPLGLVQTQGKIKRSFTSDFQGCFCSTQISL